MIMMLTHPVQDVVRPSRPQMEFDWQIGHAKPWLKCGEIMRSLVCSEDHVFNLIQDGSLDAVIDIRADDVRRPAYRVLRESFYRFLRLRSNFAGGFSNLGGGIADTATDLETVLNGYFKLLSTVLASWQAAAHLHCHESHIRTLAPHFTDIRSSASDRRYLRIHKAALLEFIKKRRVGL